MAAFAENLLRLTDPEVCTCVSRVLVCAHDAALTKVCPGRASDRGEGVRGNKRTFNTAGKV